MSTVKRLLDWQPGYRQVFYYDEETDTMGIEELWDVEPIVERAKILSEQTPGKDWRHVATIPPHVLAQSMRERWEPADWRRWANDPDNRAFRTWPGQL